MAQQAIILANGVLKDPAVLKARLADHRGGWLVIAADGGSQHAAALGLTIDAVVGDLDSIEPALRESLATTGASISAWPPEKNETDLELALLHAAAHGAGHIVVLGALGGRLDMTVANILLLTHPQMAGRRIELWDGPQTAWLVHPPGAGITGEPGDTLSLIPLGGDAHSVTTDGLAYALEDETLVFGPARGVSNILTAPQAHVALRSGLLLAVHTPGRA
jgi:thiamine pyrophosphokinase